MPKKILLVDDSSAALLMQRMVLSRARYELTTARSGIEALTRARILQPDLILLDEVMPRFDGPAAMAGLRADDATRHIPVIMVTKPVNSVELLTKVRNVLGE